MNIASYFLVSLLNLRGDRITILMLLHKVFKETYLEDDVKFIVMIEQGMRIPFVDEIDKLFKQGDNVLRKPFPLSPNAQ
jgi:hypothetical protein